MCIDIVEIWFEIANGRISSIFDGYLTAIHSYFRYRMIRSYVDQYQLMFTYLGICIGICIDSVEIGLWLLLANLSIFDVICSLFVHNFFSGR